MPSRYRDRTRSISRELGRAVSDSTLTANRLSPRRALLLGALGFVFFYFFLPWLLGVLEEHAKQNFTSTNAAQMGQVLDAVFFRRFIRPSEWAGIAIFVGCVGVALWKVLRGTGLSSANGRDTSWFARLIARLLD